MRFRIVRGWAAAAAGLAVVASQLAMVPAYAQAPAAPAASGNAGANAGANGANGNSNGSANASANGIANGNGVANVPIEGVLDHPTDRVTVSGQLRIDTRIIQDSVFRNPDVLEMAIDFSGMRGIGQRGRGSFGTDAQVIVRRTLLPRDQFDVTFPYAPGNNPNSARTAVVSIEVSAANGGVSFRQSQVRDFREQ